MADWNKLKEFFIEDKGLYFAVKRAFNDLYRYDKHLICNMPLEIINTGEIGKHYVGERSIVFRFAHYLQNELVKAPKYATYNLDCEYNRNGVETKDLPSFPNGTFPDLIIHKRGKNYPTNLVVMEFKTYWNTDTARDVVKVKEFINKKGDYRYKYGLVVLIGKTLAETKFEVYK